MNERVKVTYAAVSECGPTDTSSEYGDLTMTIEGNAESVANWLDETIMAAGYARLGQRYHHLEAKQALLDALAKPGTTFRMFNVLYRVD